MRYLHLFLGALVSSLEANASGNYSNSGPESTCLNGPCAPGNEFCGKPFQNAPAFHLMDQHGCAENDPNGPVFDPVHGVVHHFYQIHLAAAPGGGPDYGHFVSKDFVTWAALPVAIWNGLDSSVTPNRVTKYDNEAIFSGSAFVIDGAGPGGKGPGVVNIYPGLCNKKDWPQCETGTVLAQAVPADYANDELLVNWTKPSYNPIIENTQRDPSSPWKTPSGEWRLRTYDSKVYAAGSDADVLTGQWYEVGQNKDFRTCECPSFYPLPASSPGFEAEFEAAAMNGGMPTHVHKTSCGGDWWQLGTYEAGKPKENDKFHATPGWEDVFAQRKIDQGNFYASKDNEYPTKSGGTRRINWGWATVPPASAQTLPREITFNAATRTLQQYPIAEIEALRQPAAYSKTDLKIAANTPVDLGLAKGVAKQSEVVATFAVPSAAGTFGIVIGEGKTSVSCTVQFSPPTDASASFDVPVSCGATKDTLPLTVNEKTIEIRAFMDWTFTEVYFQKGRVAMTVVNSLDDSTGLSLTATTDMTAASVFAYPIKGIWTTPDAIRMAPRVYSTPGGAVGVVV